MDIKSMYLTELEDWIKEKGQPAFRAKQLYQWLHAKYVGTVEEMSNLPKSFREEIEKEIDGNSYLELQKERDFALNEIVKTRYVISRNGLEYEVDRFAFFDSFDLLEIELPSEDVEFILLEEFEVIKEVSTDYRFTNVALAKEIPTEI